MLFHTKRKNSWKTRNRKKLFRVVSMLARGSSLKTVNVGLVFGWRSNRHMDTMRGEPQQTDL